MLAFFAERGRQQIGCAVGDKVLFDEIGGRGDEYSDLDDSADLFEVAECRPGLRQDVDGAIFRGFLTGGDINVAAKQASRGQLAILQRQLAGGQQEIAAAGERDVVGDRHGGHRQGDAEIA